MDLESATQETVTHTVIESPIGLLTLVNEMGMLAGVYMSEHSRRPDPDRFGTKVDNGFDRVIDQIDEYFRGERTEFTLPLVLGGTPFQQKVWATLRTIPYGQTWSYRELAEVLGRPTAVRAVAAANGKNPVSIVVPCHRVIGSDGSLTGYAGGLERKRFLLDREKGRA